TPGDAANLETTVDDFVVDVVGELPTFKRVFVTSSITYGTMAGYAGADGRCRSAAVAAGLGGTWAAWLSVSDTDAKARIPDIEYRLVDGTTIVANSKADLLDGALLSPINKDEGGVVTNDMVWTGTNTDGTKDGSSYCFNWTGAGSVTATAGLSSSTTAWTSSAQDACDDS